MIKPSQVATIIAGAILSAGLFLLGLDPVTAGPVAASSVAATPPPAAAEPAAVPQMRAYLFRGALGPIFSRGMDHLAEEIENAGIPANVYEFTICRLIAESAIREYRKDPALIILIGHSMGGFCVLKFSEMLQTENIPVSLAVTIDPPQVSPPVPPNIERYLNIYLYYVLLNAKASEQSARMVSMKNATDSAEDLIRDLKLEYNVPPVLRGPVTFGARIGQVIVLDGAEILTRAPAICPFGASGGQSHQVAVTSASPSEEIGGTVPAAVSAIMPYAAATVPASNKSAQELR